MFYTETMGIPWTETNSERKLRELAEEYYRRTEDFDRTVCSGPIVRGCIMPANGREVSLINRYARLVNDELKAEAAKLGFSFQEWHEVKRKNQLC